MTAELFIKEAEMIILVERAAFLYRTQEDSPARRKALYTLDQVYWEIWETAQEIRRSLQGRI